MRDRQRYSEEMQSRREVIGSLGGFLWWRRRNRRVRIGDAAFEVIRNGRGERRYFWVHGNETTAGELLRSHIKSANGMALLTDSAIRYITINEGRLDPNRMFSRLGADRNLQSLNPHWPSYLLSNSLLELDRQRERFLSYLIPERNGLIIALHNNSQGYSVSDELDISNDTYLPDRDHPHEFILVTDPTDFQLLRQSPFNVVLQSSASGEDDGSLSRLCASRQIRYLNIEAGLGQSEAQRRMLDWVESRLP